MEQTLINESCVAIGDGLVHPLAIGDGPFPSTGHTAGIVETHHNRNRQIPRHVEALALALELGAVRKVEVLCSLRRVQREGRVVLLAQQQRLLGADAPPPSKELSETPQPSMQQMRVSVPLGIAPGIAPGTFRKPPIFFFFFSHFFHVTQKKKV